MNRFFSLRAILTLALLGIGVPACTTQESDSISPQTTTTSALSLSVADAQHWYIAQAGPVKPAGRNAQSSSAEPGSGPLPIDWAGAIDTTANNRAFVFAPFRDLGQGFTSGGYQTFRYLLLTRPAPNLVSGAVVEILWQNTTKPSKAAQRNLLAKLYRHYRSPSGNLPGNFTGFVFFYTHDYRYRTGTGYVNGRRLAGRMQLVLDSPNAQKESTAGRPTCTTYRITSHDPPYNVTVCQSTPDFGPPDPGQPGFFDPGYGGGAPDYPSDPGSGPGTGSGGTPTDPPVSITLGNLRPCAGQVVTDIQTTANNNILTGGPIASLIRALSANPNIRVTFGEQANLLSLTGGTSRAQTALVSSNNYTITLNSDFLQGTEAATDLAIGSEIIHEILHVYMMDWARNRNLDPNANLDFLMNLYFDPNNPDPQHETMTNMVSYMAQALLQYYNSSFISSNRLHTINQNYCEYLIWGTLRTSPSYASRAANDPVWANRVVAFTEAERRPNSAGGTVGTVVLDPKGKQPCQ